VSEELHREKNTHPHKRSNRALYERPHENKVTRRVEEKKVEEKEQDKVGALQKTLTCTLITPQGLLCEKECYVLCCCSIDGRLIIKPGHTPLLTPLKEGLVECHFEKKGTELFFKVCKGVIHITQQSVTIFTLGGHVCEEGPVLKKARSYMWDDDAPF